MTWLKDENEWLISHGIDPILAGLLMALLISGWVIPDIWPHLRSWLKSSKEFDSEFNRVETASARQHFRHGLERKHRLYHAEKGLPRENKSLVKLIDDFAFPDNFPPKADGSIVDYVENQTWIHGNELCDFLRGFYEKAIVSIDERDWTILMGHNQVSKFWDQTARLILQNRMSAKAIRTQILANHRDIIVTTLSELIFAEITPWSRGPGKIPLFRLAKEGIDLKSDKKRWLIF